MPLLEGLEVGSNGEILSPEGKPLGEITESDADNLIGKTLDEEGEIIDEDGDVIGRAELIPEEAADLQEEDLKDTVAGADPMPDLSILEGKNIKNEGEILDEEGEAIGKFIGDFVVKKYAGKISDQNG